MLSDSFAKVWRLYFRFLRKSGFLSTEHYSPLSKSEFLLLSTILSTPELSVKEYSSIVSLEQSVASRTIQRLEGEGYLRTRAEDRSKKCVLSSRGIKLVQDICQKEHAVVWKLAKTLSRNEQEAQSLEKYFMSISNENEVPEIKALPLDVLPVRGLRHMYRLFLSLSLKHFGKVSENMFHIMTALEEAQVGLSLERISKLLDIDQSTVSRSVNHLVEMELIYRSTGRSDKRTVLIQLTESGKTTHQSLFKELVTNISTKSSFREKECMEFVKVFEKFVGSNDIDTISGHSVLFGSLSITHRVSSQPSSIVTEDITLPLIWISRGIPSGTRQKSVHVHIVSLSFEEREVCKILLEEDDTSMNFTHVYSNNDSFSGHWVALTLGAIKDLIFQSGGHVKRFGNFPGDFKFSD